MSRTSRATFGVIVFAAGAGLLAGAMPLGFGWFGAGFGAALLAVGFGLFLGAKKQDFVAAPTPAHVTFYQQNRRELPTPTPKPTPAAAAPAAPGGGESIEPMTPHELELHLLEAQIHEVSRKINKATVMLGTGKLSNEGYKRYVEDLKIEKADLEARRVRLEMAKTLK